MSSILFVRSNLVFLNGDFGKWFAFSEGILDNLMPDNPMYYQFDYNRREPYVRRTSLGMKGALSADTEKSRICLPACWNPTGGRIRS